MRYEVTVQTPRLPEDTSVGRDKFLAIRLPDIPQKVWVDQLDLNRWVLRFPGYHIKDAFATARPKLGSTHKERLEACRQELLERWTTVGPLIPADDEALLEDAAEIARAK